MKTKKPLSEKIEVVGFYTEIEYKDKEGNVKMIPATKGEEGLKVKYVAEAVKEFRKEWREKCRIMEIMSGEVAIFELEGLHKKHFGSFEKEKRR